MRISHRQASILLELLSAEGFMSAEKIGSRIGLTARVVRSNLPAINAWLRGLGGSLIVKPRRGICLEIPQAMRQQLIANLPNLINGRVALSPKFRQLWVAFQLLSAEQPMSTHYFGSQLCISENTLRQDCMQIAKALLRYGISLKRSRGVGTYLEAPEINIRYALVDTLIEILGEPTIVYLCMWRKVKLPNPFSELGVLRSMTLQVLRAWKPWDSWRVVDRLLCELGRECADVDQTRMSLYLTISLMRSDLGHRVNMLKDELEMIKESAIFSMVSRLTRQGLFTHRFHFPDEEIGQLCIQIAANLGVDFWKETDRTYNAIAVRDATYLADRVMRNALAELGMALDGTSTVRKLAAHLSRYLIRIRHGLHIYNDFIDDIKRSYPEVFAAVQCATREVQDLIDGPLPEEELAFITMYVAMEVQCLWPREILRRPRVLVVCPEGGITASMLLFRLRSELPEIAAVEAISVKDLNCRKLANIDAIITTAHSLTCKGIPVICVHPLLRSEDLAKIRTVLMNPEL